LTSEEFKALYTGSRVASVSTRPIKVLEETSASSKNWVTDGAVTGVKN